MVDDTATVPGDPMYASTPRWAVSAGFFEYAKAPEVAQDLGGIRVLEGLQS